MSKPDTRLVNRWRLVLGKYAQSPLGSGFGGEGEGAYQEVDDLLDFLYGREYGEERGVLEGGGGESTLTVPRWIEKIRRLFPRETVEKLEGHALERYNLKELLTDARVLESLEPNMALLKQILALKGMMRGDVLHTARQIVRRVVEELARKMETEVQAAVMGRRDRSRSTPYRCSKNFDFRRTIRKNLQNYDPQQQRLVVEKVYFNRNLRRYNPWHIILCVDESGSMLENVIHSAVMEGIFAKLPVLTTKLVIFDTSVVELSGYIDDPVEALMSIQLGGGTDIGRALAYCESLITTPHRTIVVLISDLCEGGSPGTMSAHAHSIIEAGARLLCLTALGEEGGMYDKTAAKRLAAMGAPVAALTPGKLAGWIGEVIGAG